MLITEAAIVEAWSEVTKAQGSDETSRQVLEFANAQPALADFVLEASSQFMDSDASDLLYFIALVLWRACARAEKLRPVSVEALEASYHSAEVWGKILGAAPIIAEKKIREYNSYGQPYLMAFMVEAILECMDDGLEISPEDQALALVASKTIVDALAAQLDPLDQVKDHE